MDDAGIELLKCEPNYQIHFADGGSMTLSTDTAIMKREIERFEGKDAFSRYLAFLREAHAHYEISVTHVLRKNFPSLLSLLRPSFLRHALALHPHRSVYARASRYFHSERLRRAFTFATMYMGMSPFDAPATYSLLQYTELAEGIWYPRGGFSKVLLALAKISKDLGATYVLGTPVAAITTTLTGKRVTGVALEDGTQVFADLVINNTDLVYAYNELLPASSYATSLRSRPASCSSISFYWALTTKVPALATHNIFLADAYHASFDDIFHAHDLPADPSFYVNVPSRIDPSAAPPTADAVVVLVPCGHLTPDNRARIPALVDKARALVLSTVKARTGVDLQPLIAHEQVNDPVSWRAAFNLDRGAILGLSHSFFNVLGFRPATRHADVQGLYFVGASTHPGTGVPICLAGAKITCEQILDDARVPVPWREAAEKEAAMRKEKRSLGQVNSLWEGWFEEGLGENGWLWLVVLLLALGLGVWRGFTPLVTI